MRILVVEDEPKIAAAIKRALELQKYAVDVATNGDIGLDLAIGEEFDLIILDLMLPGIDGLSVCRQIRDQGLSVPILILTAKDQITDKVTGLDVGADDYLVKPFSFDELFARIRALIRRPRTTQLTTLSVADLTLNPTTFQVTRGKTGIGLSTKEFAILEYLMRHQNQVISRDTLIAHVWDYNADVLPNVVEVHIKHLRDKVDTPFSTQLIHTIRGRGYIIKS